MTDQPFGDIHLVHLQQGRLNVTDAHPTGIHGDDAVVKALEIFLAFGDQLGFKITVTVTGRSNIDLIIPQNNRLFTSAITAVAAVITLGIVLAVAEMIVHLNIKGTLYNSLFEIGKQPRFTPKRVGTVIALE